MKDKIKIDFSKHKEISPHLVDLREKKKVIFFIPTSIFPKISIFIAFLITVFFLVEFSLFQISNFKNELIKINPTEIESFFRGVDYLKNLKFSEAKEKFIFTESFFSEKIKKIEKMDPLTKFFLKNYPPAKIGIALLEFFRDSSKIGLLIIETSEELPPLFKKEEINSQQGILPAEVSNLNFLEITSFLKRRLNEISFLFNNLEKNFLKLKPNYLPKNFQNSFILIKKEIPLVKEEIDQFKIFLENLEEIVGQDSFKRYLILFQNNHEIRATGGFLGSFALIDFEKGKIMNFEMPAGGTYDLVGNLKVRVSPPLPFFVAYPNWKFHDANWFPDWPTSAKKLIWFYERSGGSTVDGVIAINAELISDILGEIGEISLTEDQKKFNRENFILEIEKIIEEERKRKSREPKKVLVDLTPIFLKKILEIEPLKFFQILRIIYQGLNEKKIQLYFSDQKLEEFFKEKNWAGEIKDAPLDYLFVVISNVNGAKTEGVISQKIFYNLEIDRNGSMIGTLKITRKHNGKIEDFFTGRKDLSWVRVYLPKETIFLGAQGATKKEFLKTASEIPLDEDLKTIENEIMIDKFSQTKITKEFNKICFANFLEIAPGEEKTISFKFLLPFKLNFSNKPTSYSLFVQKQSGRVSEFEAEIILPEGKKIVWVYPEGEITQHNHLVKISSILNRDKFFAFLIE